MREVAVLIDNNHQPIYWHVPDDRSSGAIPDSRQLWDAIWENRDNLAGIAHSHPGSGMPGPSMEDLTTFSAIEGSLGRQLQWWITSADEVSIVLHIGPGRYDYEVCPQIFVRDEPPWVAELRRRSG